MAGTPGVHSESPAQLAAITRESCIAIVAEIGGVVAGFCQVLPPGATYESVNYQWFSARYDDFIYLDRVAVGVEHRGRGIGSRLYEEVERRTRAAWFTPEVNLRPRNDGSLRFHARPVGRIVARKALRSHPTGPALARVASPRGSPAAHAGRDRSRHGPR
ncbi:MAG: GNAT family N-acetyltransferase [Polyangiaceae bacterium]